LYSKFDRNRFDRWGSVNVEIMPEKVDASALRTGKTSDLFDGLTKLRTSFTGRPSLEMRSLVMK
jgi:hypothetical protein